MNLLPRLSVVGLYCVHYLTWKGRGANLGEISEQGCLGLEETREALDRLVQGGILERGDGGRCRVSYDPLHTSVRDILLSLEASPPEASGRSLGSRIRTIFNRLFHDILADLKVVELFNGKPVPVPCLAETPRDTD